MRFRANIAASNQVIGAFCVGIMIALGNSVVDNLEKKVVIAGLVKLGLHCAVSDYARNAVGEMRGIR